MINDDPALTRAALIQEAIRRLAASNIADARRNVEWMLCELLHCNRASLYAYPEKEIETPVRAAFELMLTRRMTGEPLQYILGHTTFFGLRIEVTPAVLIPRPETEQVVEKALNLIARIQKPCVLDIGTGSGCIPIAIKHEKPEAEVFACDVSPAALDVAHRNASRLKTPITFFSCDVKSVGEESMRGDPFDLIVSNPPYIPDEEYADLAHEIRSYEPALALQTGPDPLLFYRQISQRAPRWLKKNGILLFETHSDFAREVAKLLELHGFTSIHVDSDLSGKPRMAYGSWPG